MRKQIICPIYNEGENVKQLYESLKDSGAEFDELAFVHDQETDTSLPFIEAIRSKDERVIAVRNTRGARGNPRTALCLRARCGRAGACCDG